MEKLIITSILSLHLILFPVVNSNINENNKMKADANISTESWNLVKSADKISIYERWIKTDENRTVRQLWASMTVKASNNRIIEIIKDDKKALQWQSGLKEFYRIKKIDDDNWYAYTLYGIPWPLNDQDIVTKYQVRHSRTDSKVKILMTGMPDYIPVNKGISRISHYCGIWELTPLQNGFCRIDYYVYSKQKSSFPKWLVDPIVRTNLWNTFDNLRKIINTNTVKAVES